MRIAVAVTGRAHEGGVTTYINSIVDPLRTLGHTVEVVTPFGISEFRVVRRSFTARADHALRNRSLLTMAAYLVAQFMILCHLAYGHLRRGYDVILAIDVAATNVSLWMRQLLGVPVVERVGGLILKDMIYQRKLRTDSTLRRFFAWQEKRAFRRADAVIPISSWIYQYVKSVCSSAKVRSPMINGVDERLFYPDVVSGQSQRRRLGISDDTWVIFFPSRLEMRKGPVVAMGALRRLLHSAPGYALVYSGTGPARAEIEQLRTANHLKGHIHMLGGIPHDQMRSLYNMADVTVIPSIIVDDWEEPLANCLLESMACGTPVIASDIGGLRDSVLHEKTGLRISQNDDEALAKSILRLQQNGQIREGLISAALEMIRERCSSIGVARQLEAVFQDQLKTARRGRSQ